MGLLKVVKAARHSAKHNRKAMAKNPKAWNAGQLTASAVLSLHLSGPKAERYAAAFQAVRDKPDELGDLATLSLKEEGIPRFVATLHEAENRAPTESEVRVFSFGYTNAFVEAARKMAR